MRIFIIVLGIVTILAAAGYFIRWGSGHLFTSPLGKHYFKYEEDGKAIVFELDNHQTALPDIRVLLMLGYNIMLNTGSYAKEYVFNRLTCVNCHFCAGNTTGGRNGSISLVGVTTAYPAYS